LDDSIYKENIFTLPDNTLVKDVLKPEAPIMYDLSNLLDKDGPVLEIVVF